jgi:hypothetical protein
MDRHPVYGGRRRPTGYHAAAAEISGGAGAPARSLLPYARLVDDLEVKGGPGTVLMALPLPKGCQPQANNLRKLR